MSKYKIGDKVVLEITDKVEVMGDPWYLLSNATSIFESWLDKAAEPLSAYTEPLERKNENKQKQIEKLVDKLHRQAAEITRLLAENKELKEDFEKSKRVNLNMGRLAGQNEAWELARKIASTAGGLSSSELVEIFNAFLPRDILSENTYPEAAAKVEAWEKATIKRGDEVEKNDLRDARFIVTFTNGKLMSGVTQSGLVFSNEKTKDWHKTGRHIDIDSFLKQIRGEA